METNFSETFLSKTAVGVIYFQKATHSKIIGNQKEIFAFKKASFSGKLISP